MGKYDPIPLLRDVEAVEIPSGVKVTLPKDSTVTVMQTLGGTFTVFSEAGFQARIDGKDADAMGLEQPPPSTAPIPGPQGDTPLEKQVWDVMKTCYDPEIPVNIVDLGLVYACEVKSNPAGGSDVRVVMTLTAPGCGMGDIIRADVQNRIMGLDGIATATVDVVVEPPWNPSMMSDVAKLQLGM